MSLLGILYHCCSIDRLFIYTIAVGRLWSCLSMWRIAVLVPEVLMRRCMIVLVIAVLTIYDLIFGRCWIFGKGEGVGHESPAGVRKFLPWMFYCWGAVILEEREQVCIICPLLNHLSPWLNIRRGVAKRRELRYPEEHSSISFRFQARAWKCLLQHLSILETIHSNTVELYIK